MFTLEEIEKAHDNGGGLAGYITELSKIGVVRYVTCIEDGHSEFFDERGNKCTSNAVHESFIVKNEYDGAGLEEVLKHNEIGKIDYLTMSKQLTSIDVHTWNVDVTKKQIQFCDRAGDVLLTQQIIH